VNGSGQFGVRAHVCRSWQPARAASRSVSRITVRSAILASISASLSATRLCRPTRDRPCWRPKVDQLDDLGQCETKALRGLDDPHLSHRLGRVDPVPAQAALWLGEQSAALVVPQRLLVHAGRDGEGAAAQPGHG